MISSLPLKDRFRDIMFDIETLGTGPNAAILSIGACAFNPATGEVNDVDTFYWRVDLAKSRSPGDIDASTVAWWMQQSDAARKAAFTGIASPLHDVLESFWSWACRFSHHNRPELDDTLNVWCNPPTFDEVIVKEACKRSGKTYPFHYRTSRCMRTLKCVGAQMGFAVDLPFEGVAHNALADSIYQAKVVCATFALMRATKVPA